MCFDLDGDSGRQTLHASRHRTSTTKKNQQSTLTMSLASERYEEDVMNELIEQLKSRVGLDDSKANSAAQTVLEFLKQRLPAPIASQVETALKGGGTMEGMKDALGGVLGKRSA
jgi:hypothetical protein